MEHREGMDMGKGAPGSGAERPPERPEEGMAGELGRRSESLGDSLRSFESEMGDAERTLERIKDPAKREEFRTALASLRGRTSGIGNSLRATLAALALFAAGAGVGRGMDAGRHQDEMVDMAKRAGEAEGENKALKEELARRDAADARRDDADASKAVRVETAGQRAAETMAAENKELRSELAAMSAELAKIRQDLDEANGRVLAEKTKGIVSQEALMKQQVVSGNLMELFKKMHDLIERSGDPKMKEDAERFLAAYE